KCRLRASTQPFSAADARSGHDKPATQIRTHNRNLIPHQFRKKSPKSPKFKHEPSFSKSTTIFALLVDLASPVWRGRGGLITARGNFTKLKNKAATQRKRSHSHRGPSLEQERVVVLDVGAAGGVQPAWLPELEHIDLVMVEPAPTEVAKLEAQLKENPSVSI